MAWLRQFSVVTLKVRIRVLDNLFINNKTSYKNKIFKTVVGTNQETHAEVQYKFYLFHRNTYIH
jgi:hypothetical protein